MLPLADWATRFTHGEVALTGRIKRPLDVAGAELCPGPVQCQVRFEGGDRPRIDQISVTGLWAGVPVVTADSRTSDLSHRSWHGSIHSGPLAKVMVGAMWDLEADAWAISDHEVEVGFGRGLGRVVEFGIPAGTCVRLRGESVGPPSKPVLSGPLSLSVGGAWIRLGGDRRVRWLSSLARVRVERAILHPDGRVALDGGARRILNRAARGGLAHASARISELVQHSPRFVRVRSFLVS